MRLGTNRCALSCSHPKTRVSDPMAVKLELSLGRSLGHCVPPLLHISLGLRVRVLCRGFRVDDSLVEAHARSLHNQEAS